MLSVLYAAIATELAAINAYVVPLVGEEHVRRNDAPPRMIMFPLDDSFGDVEGPGGNPRPIKNVLKASQLVIHGQTTDHVEGMRDQFVIALHAVCKKATAGSGGRAGRYVLSKGMWTRNSLIVKNGHEYKLTFAVGAPIVKRTWETPLPGDPPQAPVAATYAGDQANTYPVVPADELAGGITVGLSDDESVDIAIEDDPTP